MPMRAFITGINGFTGQHLNKLLQSQKVTVSGFDGNLKDKLSVFTAVSRAKPDWIFHLASPILRSDQLLDQSLAANLEVDLFGTVYLLEAAAALKHRPKILITGTAAQYAPSPKPLTETSPLKPLTSYGLSKLTQELVSRQLARSYNLPLIFTRTFLLVGPGQKPGFVVTDLAKTIAQGAKEITLGNPNIRRDFTEVRDACRAYYLLMKKGKPDETYNVCSGKAVSIASLAAQLVRLSRKKIDIKKKSSWRKNDPSIICGDHSKLTKTTSWQPQISLSQNLKDTLNYWRKQSRSGSR